MISELQLRNFKCYKKKDISLSPYVNIIVGNNAVGKSTLLRSIKWVAKNKPAGDSVINWDADKAAVRITLGDYRITRTKGKGVNTYKLLKRGWKKSKVLKALKKNKVPEEIQKIINLSDINFQGQHEAPFWFCETPGEVSRQLNAIVNLDIIDTTMSNITSALYKSRITINIVKGRLEENKLRQKELAYVKEMDSDLKVVENAERYYLKIAADYNTIQDILEETTKYRRIVKNARGLRTDGLIAITKGREYQRIVGSDQYELLLSLINTIKEHKEIKCRVEKQLKKCKMALDKIADERCPLCGRAKKKL